MNCALAYYAVIFLIGCAVGFALYAVGFPY
jgi:hypothetical protein